MASVLLTAAGLVSLLVLACGPAPSTYEGGGDGVPSDPKSAAAPSDAPPSQGLTNAPAHASDHAADPRAGAWAEWSAAHAAMPGPGTTPANPNAGAGPKPAGTCSVTKDSAGFFTRGSGASSYVAYVPATYNGSTPMRLIVGVHGCGDSAYNFATWGVNPYETRTTQTHIGISIGGQDGNCWSASDDAKVLAAVADISSCFWVHQKKIVLAGYSSGGELTYRLGMSQAAHFAGLLIEDSGLYDSGVNETTVMANAAWKLHIAHRTHTSDPVYPLAQVKADWAKEQAAGFPLMTSETAGDHNGTSTDWATWLIPNSASWVAP